VDGLHSRSADRSRVPLALQDAGFEEIEIRETHRAHEHACAAIIRARKPAPATNAACTLDAAERAAQLERYRALGRHATDVEHKPGRVVICFSDDPPTSLLERTVEVERGCCPFFDIHYEPAGRRLVIAVEDPNRDPDLDALARALTQPRTTDSLPAGVDATALGEVVTSCCSSAVLETCCEPHAKDDCCGHATVEAPSRCGCR
jgi:hypothetical protein